MAFAELDRVAIRRYLGFAAIFLQADPRLESAITAVQSQADGGSRPDNTSETAVCNLLVELAQLEAKLKEWRDALMAGEVGSVKVDFIRSSMFLKTEGFRLVGHLTDILSTRPVRNVFQGPALQDGATFTRSYLQQAWRSL